MLEAMNVDVETDMDVVRKLLTKYSEDIDDETKIVVLEDLEYYSHQVSFDETSFQCYKCTRAVLLMQRICTCMQSSGLTGLVIT